MKKQATNGRGRKSKNYNVYYGEIYSGVVGTRRLECLRLQIRLLRVLFLFDILWKGCSEMNDVKIRSELSENNRYHLEKHRFLELKHFCLQYPVWKKAKSSLSGLSKSPSDISLFRTNQHGNPTERCAMALMFYDERIEMVERAAHLTDEVLHSYILKAVTEGLSYDILRAQTNIPCCRDIYYENYRKFFWILNDIRK